MAPLSAPDRDQVRQEHAEWSQSTFGNVGPVGPLKHLSKEALEAAAEPGDLSEWADMQFLLWDAQRRAGITDEQITQAMIDKLAVNKQREWPEPKDGEPRLHIKEQPVPVVPKSMSVRQAISALESAGAVTTIGQAYKMGWNAFRAAMRQELKKSAGTEAICRSDENVQVLHTKSPAQSDCCPAQNQGWIPVSERMPIEFEAVIAFDGDQVYGEAMHSSDDGFTIDGYDPCDRVQLQNVTHWMPLPSAPQEVKGE
ncbi:TPA: DUF550 domain-containing protein [Klebsiella pneumoniae]|nr:DUF550 domain-containing protein [Klebsiella pneumoniae]